MKLRKKIKNYILNSFIKHDLKAGDTLLVSNTKLHEFIKINPRSQSILKNTLLEMNQQGYIKLEDSSFDCLRLTTEGYNWVNNIDDTNLTHYKTPIAIDHPLKKSNNHQILPVVIILTAIRQEYDAVRLQLINIRDASMNDTSYERGVFEFEGNHIADVVFRECGKRNTNASQEAERAIFYFKPVCMFFVGIAGSRKSQDFSIGDVVFADKIYSYEGGKSEKNAFRSRPDLTTPSYTLCELAKKERRSDNWKQLIKGGGDNSEIKADTGVIASGEQLIEHYDSSIGKILTNHFNDTSAVEMEGFGFANAITRQGRETSNIQFGVIRGISDVIEYSTTSAEKIKQAAAFKNNNPNTRTEGVKQQASNNATAFAFWIIYKLFE